MQSIYVLVALISIVSALPANRKIVGGELAAKGEFPWIVTLQLYIFEEYGHYCAGVLVHKDWVLTAAQCVNGIEPNLFLIIAGINNFNEIGEEAYIDDVIFHPDFEGDGGPNDLALLKLDLGMSGSYIEIIDLPDVDDVISGSATLAGWGSISSTNTSKYPNNLQKVEDLKIIDFAACSTALKEAGLNTTRLAPTNICTDSAAGTVAACSGDNGGPLTIIKDGEPVLAGIVSWNVRPCASSKAPSIYSDMRAYKEWIDQTISTYSQKQV